MKRISRRLLLIAVLCLFATPLLAAKEIVWIKNEDYVIGPGDILDISVWKEEALTKLVTVLPDGKMSFPLIGQIVAGGKTLDQLRVELEEKLTRYVPDLTLSVGIYQVNSMVIYVIGKVNRPGNFGLNARINVLQALSMAGGLNPFAKSGDIKIFRKEDGQDQILPFDYDDVSKGEKPEQNIWLKRGDVVVVP
jgi:polysaccharide export outer membrane protein